MYRYSLTPAQKKKLRHHGHLEVPVLSSTEKRFSERREPNVRLPSKFERRKQERRDLHTVTINYMLKSGDVFKLPKNLLLNRRTKIRFNGTSRSCYSVTDMGNGKEIYPYLKKNENISSSNPFDFGEGLYAVVVNSKSQNSVTVPGTIAKRIWAVILKEDGSFDETMPIIEFRQGHGYADLVQQPIAVKLRYRKRVTFLP